VIKGWTEFLKELAPPSIFDDMREPEGKVQQERQRLLSQIYDLTKKEEEYETGDIGLWIEHPMVPSTFTDQRTDAEDVFYWPADDLDDKSVAKKRNRRSWDLVVDDSGTNSYADSAPLPKRSKKNSSATTPAGAPAAPLRRRTHLDISMQDCKPHSNAGFLSDARFVRSATTSLQGPWDHCPSVGDVKNQRFIFPMEGHAQSVHDNSCVPQAYTTSSPWINGPSPAPFSEPERQAISQAFAMDMPTPTLPGRIFQWPYQNLEAQSQVCPAYMALQRPQPQFQDVSMDGSCTPSIPSHTPPEGLQPNPYLNGVYYCQPSGAQPFPSPTLQSTPQLNNMSDCQILNINVHPSFRPCTTTTTEPPDPCCTIDPSVYRQYPESGLPLDQYPHFRHGGHDVQAPARVERGFTGHGSGVGGGAHT